MTGAGPAAASSLHAARARRGGPLLCGHRGASATHPENTVVAVEAALVAGCDAVEVDVHVTADGALAVLHDPRVDRTTDGTGEVADMTAAQARGLDAGSWCSPRFAGAGVPLLGEVLASCRERAIVLVEVKADFERRPDAASLVVGDVARRGAVEGAAVLAFDHRHLEVAAGVDPGLARVALCRAIPEDPALLLASLGAAALGPPAALVDAALCDEVHAAGGLVVAWTVDDPEEARSLVAAGADVLVSNDPARLLPVIRTGGAARS